ncbi:bifunctional 2',3'-cyclic-nucleotide 2'-phosphodiesterase/3'-nucleotidase [Alkalicoccus chagannorensis]|uniref:bifunctional 2',3'-cyclic-nucleotide 2'-phosphodiesterase/3'-nucleotidase n=1 Tax=Alkalicoccus chagannorensis TaxID=427072 RepID=UPI0004113B25|nr:bifunctional 2',3'-cyclic-nucleotide 2'-phosphodiesterase/3'-nucleotidase [Alkalicoccus chagannorensis]
MHSTGFSKWMKRAVAAGAASLVFMPAQALADDHSSDVNNGEGDHHELTIMGTTDIHSYLMPYDYMNDEEVDDYGFVKAATLIEQVRAEKENTILFDNGDTFEGSMLGELETLIEPLEEDETQAVIKLLNELDVQAASIGNHEFNFGLDYLDDAIDSADYPWLSANVYEAGTDREEHYFEPYTVVEHEVDGKPLDIGVIGFVPPQIMQWDNLHLEGNVEVREIVESAERYLPDLQEESDIVVALAHTGVNTSDRGSEHAAVDLAQVDGIDAMVMGHAHQTFPGNSGYDEVDGVDDEAGTIHGVPAVMAGSWGSHLGTIDLDLYEEDGEWTVGSAYSEVTGVEDTGVEPNDTMVDMIADVHERTLDYISETVGHFTEGMNTFFSLVMDNEVTQIVNDAQLWFAEEYFADSEYEEKPILSASAPFRAGYRGGYTEVDAGPVTIGDLADIYLYSNTLQVVDLDGDELVQWMERSAESFNQIDPDETDDQYLLASFSAFNFDIMEGVEYEIDVTQPEGERITNLTYNGEEVTGDDEFYVVTNNYRAGGGGDHLDDADLVESLVDMNVQNRQIIADFLGETGDYTPHATMNWEVKPVETAGDVTFNSSLDAPAHAEQLGLDQVSYTGETTSDGDGAVFTYNLNALAQEEEDTPVMDFVDFDEENYGHHTVQQLVSNGIIQGFPGNEFRPNASITRADTAIMLTRALGLHTNVDAEGFADVSEDHYAANAVAAVQAAGIFQGDGNDSFRPNDDITRGEIAAVLVRAYDMQVENAETAFTDAEGIFEDYIAVLDTLELTSGVSETTFGTNQAMTRQDFSILLHQAHNQ